jgi:hypothetical protein
MSGFVKEILDGRHLLEKALANLEAAYQRRPYPELAATIEVVRAEIELVGNLLKLHEAPSNRVCDRLLPTTQVACVTLSSANDA